MTSVDKFVAGVRPTGCGTQIEVALDQLTQAEVLGQGGRQEEPRVGHQALVVEGHIEAVEAVRRSHRCALLIVGRCCLEQLHRPRSEGHLFACPGSRISRDYR